MTSVIREIYNDMMAKGLAVTPEYRELCRKNDMLLEKIRPLLGEETIEKLQNNQSDIVLQTNLEWFREGIRIGAAFMRELL